MASMAPARDRAGLRERKKRQMRQLISDTATDLFLAAGFDRVRVADVAVACDVSEKTIYNYFPTKEALVFDREATSVAMIQEALGASDTSPVDAMITVIKAELDHLFAPQADDQSNFRRAGQFWTMIEQSPALRAAQRDLIDRLTQAAASAMADRAGVSPLDPEPQIAATALVGVWAVAMRALKREMTIAGSAADARAAILSDTRRAARVVEAGVASFALNPSHRRTPDKALVDVEAVGVAQRAPIVAELGSRNEY